MIRMRKEALCNSDGFRFNVSFVTSKAGASMFVESAVESVFETLLSFPYVS